MVARSSRGVLLLTSSPDQHGRALKLFRPALPALGHHHTPTVPMASLRARRQPPFDLG